MDNTLVSLQVAESSNKVLQEEYWNKSKHISSLNTIIADMEKKEKKIKNWLKVTGITSAISVPVLLIVLFK